MLIIILNLTMVNNLYKSIQAYKEGIQDHLFLKELNYCVHLLKHNSEFLQNFSSILG